MTVEPLSYVMKIIERHQVLVMCMLVGTGQHGNFRKDAASDHMGQMKTNNS